ncbi:hypothetical protein pb186bvf_013910 [Paramecium bursaria]
MTITDELVSPGKNVNFQSGLEEVWKQNGLVIVIFILRFMKKLTSNINVFPFRQLNVQNFQALNDKAAYYRFYVNKHYITNKLTLMVNIQINEEQIRYYFNANKYLNKIKTYYKSTILSFVINPNNTFKIIFDSFVLLILILNVTFVPIRVCFNADFDYVYLFTIVPDYIFIFVIMVRFNTAYYYSGVLIETRKKIAKNYIKNGLLSDIISIIPLILNFTQDNIWCLLIIFRINYLVKLSLEFEENLNLRKNYGTYIDVVKLFSVFLYSSQMFACLFFYLGSYEISIGINNTWIQNSQIYNTNWLNQYITAMYWGCVTTVTIGYGDITPSTEYEKLYVIVVSVFSSLVFGFTISNIGQIFSNLAEQSKTQRQKMSVITAFIKKRKLNKNLEIKVKKFFEYYFQIEENKDAECQRLMKLLSEDLNNEVRIDFYRKYLLNSNLIKNTFSLKFIELACLQMNERLLIPDEKYAQKGDIVDELSFVIDGELEYLIEYDSTKTDRVSIIRKILPLQSISQGFFFSNQPLPYTIKSTSFSTIVELKTKQFNELLEQFPLDKEKFYQLKNQLIMNEESGINCEICDQNHKLDQCHVLFYKPRARRTQNIQNKVKQQRTGYKRNKRLFYKTFHDKLVIQEAALTYAVDENLVKDEQINEEFIQKYDFVRLRNAELNQEQRKRHTLRIQKPLSDQSTQSPSPKRRNAVRLSINELIRSPQKRSIELIHQIDESQIVDDSIISVENQLYEDYLKFLKIDQCPDLDRFHEFNHYYPQDNCSNVIQRAKAISKYSGQHQIKKLRRLIKQSTWTDTSLINMIQIIGLIIVIFFSIDFFWEIYRIIISTSDIQLKYGKNCWAIITGASDGIGKAFVQELAKQNVNVCLIVRNVQKAQQVIDEIKSNSKSSFRIVQADFMNSNKIEFYENILKQVQDLDIGLIVNNVGYLKADELQLMKKEDVEQQLIINLFPVVMLTKKLIPLLQKRKRSGIINLSSMQGKFPIPFTQIYSGTRAFVDLFSRSLDQEYINIDVLSLRPFYVQTQMVKHQSDLSTITPTQCAQGGLLRVGLVRESFGHWRHRLIGFIYDIFDDTWIYNQLITPISKQLAKQKF